jgi:excisionase family DNA binding protein
MLSRIRQYRSASQDEATTFLPGARLNPLPEPTENPNEQLLDSQQLAHILQVPVTWIEQKAREGTIPSLPVGRRRRCRRSAVEAARDMTGTPFVAPRCR